MVDESYLEIKDYIDNGVQPINLYWNMATTAVVESLSASKLKLTQGGKTSILEIVSSNPGVSFNIVSNRSADPVSYFPSATYERKNEGAVMIGFEALVPANEVVTFTITLKDGAEVSPSSTEPVNYILLELPNPNTGLEGNTLYYDTSELYVDGSGEVSTGGISSEYAWNVYGNTNLGNIFNKKFFFRWQGTGATNTASGTNYGAMLTKAGIDRSASGELGIRGGESNGIDVNEGYQVGFDASMLPNSMILQLTKVGVNLVTGTRTGMVVNRNETSKKKSFGGSTSSANVILSSGSGLVSVEDLDIKVRGGQTNYEMASIFNAGTSGNFRITRFVFKIIFDESTLSLSPATKTLRPEYLEKELVLYPNPFTDNITFQNIVTKTENIQVKLYNLSGYCLFSNNYLLSPTKNEVKLDLRSIRPGMFIIQIIYPNGSVVTKRILKQ